MPDCEAFDKMLIILWKIYFAKYKKRFCEMRKVCIFTESNSNNMKFETASSRTWYTGRPVKCTDPVILIEHPETVFYLSGRTQEHVTDDGEIIVFLQITDREGTVLGDVIEQFLNQ
jgi:hypothetical protein